MKFIKNRKLLMVVGLLLQVDIDFAVCDNSRLVEIVERDNLEELEIALKDSGVVNEVDEIRCVTALMLAVRKNRLDMVKLLLDKRANPYITPRGKNNTALREAVRLNHDEITKLLLARCYNRDYKRGNNYPNSKEPYYNYVSAWDLENDSTNYERSLGYALIEAAKKGRKDLVKLFYDKGAHPNIVATPVNDKGYNSIIGRTTALIEAVKRNDTEMVMLLFDINADINVEIRCAAVSGYYVETTALMEAVRSGHLDMVQLLLDRGANRYARNQYGYQALDIAENAGHREIYKLLARDK